MSTPVVLPFFYALFTGECSSSDQRHSKEGLASVSPSNKKDGKPKETSVRQQKK